MLKKFGPIFKELLNFFPEIFQYALKYMGLGSGIRDPGSGIRDPRSWIRKKPIPDPGSRGQKGIGSRIRNNGRLGFEPRPVTPMEIPLLSESNDNIWSGPQRM